MGRDCRSVRVALESRVAGGYTMATVATSPSTAPWAAALHLAPGSALYVGPLNATGRHRHHALQVCVGGAAGFRLRLGPRDPWQALTAAVVDADVPHQFDGRGELHAMLYLEPEYLTERLGVIPAGAGLSVLVNDGVETIRLGMAGTAAGGFAPEKVRELHRRMLHILGHDVSGRRPLDARIERLLDAMRRSPAAAWSLADAAAVMTLSIGRARHLFVGEIGITLRRFRRWIRLEAALHVLAGGQSLTTAAHSAGFADSAHLSRAFREMFGMAPSTATSAARILVDHGRGLTVP